MISPHSIIMLPRVFVVILSLISGSAPAAVDLVDAATGMFPLVSAGKAAPIVLPPDAPEVVRIAARDLAADIAAVSGVTPKVLVTAPAAKSLARVELSLAPDLAGKWEAFRLAAKPGVLTVSGSDRRGLAFGIYEVSSRIGVSPWRWWADVPVTPRQELRLSVGEEPVDQPAVKYRGIFLNDEDWGLQPWAARNFEPDVKDIGPRTYAKIFELLLRLRANTIWPAMHECTKAFHLVQGNAAAADAYSIVVGSSHAEPMLRSNTTEWTAPKEDYNYLKNPAGVSAYWEERVKERRSGESLFTIGMRGIHDSAIVGPKNGPERIATLERIFSDQRELLAKYLGKGDPSRVGQIFVPYKEVLEDYDAGLKVPQDVSIMWTDDNFGYIRRHATPEERKRSGGFGIYYHASYLGAPLSWLWIDTLPPALVWSEMMRAYEHGARSVWIVNAGDIKNTERSVEFFLDLAWHADRTDPGAPDRFMRKAASRDLGKEHAAAVTGILSRLQAINFSRKTEHLQWHSTGTPYKPTELNEAEIGQRLKACEDLLRDSDALAAKLPPTAGDAYFQLVGYPVAITAAVNERYFQAELARADSVRGRSPEINQAASLEAGARIKKLTDRYNNGIAGGKWRGVVTVNGMSAKSWTRFQPGASAPPAPTPANICPPAPPSSAPVLPPGGARSGDFVERDRVVAIDAGHFTAKKDGVGEGWHVVPGLGRTGTAVTVLPSTAVIKAGAAPVLEYRFHTTTRGPAKIHVRLVPTHPLVSDQGLRLALSIDNGEPIPLAVTNGFNPKSKEWGERVLSNATGVSADIPGPLAPGWHTLRLVAVDAGVVLDKIVLDLGGLQPSYDGPVETRVP